MEGGSSQRSLPQRQRRQLHYQQNQRNPRQSHTMARCKQAGVAHPILSPLRQQNRTGPSTADDWLTATINRPWKWVLHHCFDVYVFKPNGDKWQLAAKQPVHQTKMSHPVVLLLQGDRFTTVTDKPRAAAYQRLDPPPVPATFHGSGADASCSGSGASSSWCKPLRGASRPTPDAPHLQATNRYSHHGHTARPSQHGPKPESGQPSALQPRAAQATSRATVMDVPTCHTEPASAQRPV